MKIDQKVVAKLEELIKEADAVLQTHFCLDDGYGWGGNYVESQVATRWGVSCLFILDKYFNKDSDYYRNFQQVNQNIDRPSQVKNGKGILEAAKREYEQGFIQDVRNIIQAEVFDDLLEQAQHLLDNGYHQPAAVIAGAVLEDGLRKLCDARGIKLAPKTMMGGLNAELAKNGVYSALTNKKVTFLAEIRNKAAHGLLNEFNEKDVCEMIKGVRRFLEEHF